MQIPSESLRERLEKELASVRAQRDQAIAVLQQATGAEKALTSVLTILIEVENAAIEARAAEEATASARNKPKTASINGVPTQ